MNINDYTNSLIESKRESIKEETVEELKKSCSFTCCKNSECRKEQENVAESVLTLFESAILDTRSKLPKDKDILRKLLIQTAKSNRFKEKDYNVWGNPGYNDEKENWSQLSKFKTYKLGYCFRDDGDNYICYNFEADTFHFFHHEESGCDNMARKAWSLEKIISYINEWK